MTEEQNIQQDVKVLGMFKPEDKICSELPTEDLVGQLQEQLASVTTQLVLWL